MTKDVQQEAAQAWEEWRSSDKDYDPFPGPLEGFTAGYAAVAKSRDQELIRYERSLTALMPYVQHQPECGEWYRSQHPCSCGLAALLHDDGSKP